MWMNAMDIDDAVSRITRPTHLREAALFLQAFKELINDISDGWPYWSYGTKCSSDLQKIVSDAQWPVNQIGDGCSTPAEVRKACLKVSTFLRRCQQTRDNHEVLRFIETWKP